MNRHPDINRCVLSCFGFEVEAGIGVDEKSAQLMMLRQMSDLIKFLAFPGALLEINWP